MGQKCYFNLNTLKWKLNCLGCLVKENEYSVFKWKRWSSMCCFVTNNHCNLKYISVNIEVRLCVILGLWSWHGIGSGLIIV